MKLCISFFQLFLLTVFSGVVQGKGEDQSDREVVVMTRNLYLGADVDPIFLAKTEEEAFTAIITGFATVLASKVELRMESVAAEIEETGAMLVGLQEATTIAVNGQVIDFAEILVEKLSERELYYELVTKQDGFFFPFQNPDGNFYQFTTSDVILAKSDVKCSNPQAGQYDTSLPPLNLFGAEIQLPRQWVSVDAKIRGKDLRFVSTHLESISQFIRIPQALELLDPNSAVSPLNTELPIILVGDFNDELSSTGGVTAADQFVAAGFVDAWTKAGDGDGFTFGRDPLLADPSAEHSKRIDYIMTRGNQLEIAKVSLVDTTIGDTSPLWPSDHAGVIASIVLSID